MLREKPMSADPDRDQCKAELEAVIASGIFAKAPSLALLLDYVCAKYFEGQANQIKEYNIAVEALGRPPSFDPRQDSIVRVEAFRLRKRLKQYYEHEGADRHLRIVIPSGQYVPQFLENGPGASNGEALDAGPDQIPDHIDDEEAALEAVAAGGAASRIGDSASATHRGSGRCRAGQDRSHGSGGRFLVLPLMVAALAIAVWYSACICRPRPSACRRRHPCRWAPSRRKSGSCAARPMHGMSTGPATSGPATASSGAGPSSPRPTIRSSDARSGVVPAETRRRFQL
jgi:hypothetical protein